MPGVGAPMIGGIAGQPKGLQQRFELQKAVGFAATKDVESMEKLGIRPLQPVLRPAYPGTIA
jgi:hypothetical protein